MDNRHNLRVPLGQLNVCNNATESASAMTGSNTTTKTRTIIIGLRDIKISARLKIRQGAPVTGFVDMHIHMPKTFTFPKKTKMNCNGDEDHGVFLGTRNQYAMCSIYVQIGKLLGVRPRNGKDSMFQEIYRHWSLSRSQNSVYGGRLVRTIDDIADGDRLTLDCGSFHKSTKLAADFVHRLPSEVRYVVKVSLISTRRNCDHDASAVSSENINSPNKLPKVPAAPVKRIATYHRPIDAPVVHITKCSNEVMISPLRNCDHDVIAGSSENINSPNKRPKVAAAPGKQIATDCRPVVAPVVHGPKHSIEVIEFSSDDQSEVSSIYDVTAEWRAKRDEERRKMRENAEEID